MRCGDVRPLYTNATAQMSGDGGTCVLDACDPGYVDCNNDAADGCEVRFGPAPSQDLPEVGNIARAGADGGMSRPVYGSRRPEYHHVDGDPSDWTTDSVPLVPLRERVRRMPGQ